ncbi:MAG: 2-hydroxychromene-2-carboxylate isomerase [Pseudomonadota bacterium]
MTAPLEFWFDFASTYSYPAAMAVTERAAARGVEVSWRPMLLGPIFAAQGWRDSPFNIYPTKGAYMWRDLERICAAEGLPLTRPDPFPQHSLAAARLAILGCAEGWGEAFCRAVFQAEFAEGRDISDPGTLAMLVKAAHGPADAAERAFAEPNKTALKHQVALAQQKGIFGAPSFTVGDELFWGFDRMEAAIAWAVDAQPPVR